WRERHVACLRGPARVRFAGASSRGRESMAPSTQWPGHGMTAVASAATACQKLPPSPDGANGESQVRRCQAVTRMRGRCECQGEPPFINGGNGEHATSCQWLSPFLNGDNEGHARSCQWLSPFLNGDNEGHARSCQWMSPFRNGGNGQSARR